MRALLLYLVVAGRLFAADYYIDWTAGDDSNNGSKSTPWKRAPGMTNFAASYSHANGDRFIFKGGETWPLSELNAGGYDLGGNEGTSGTPDVWTGGQLEDPPWGTGFPVFDGEGGINDNAGIIELPGLNNVTINGLHLKDAGANDGADFAPGGIRLNDTSIQGVIISNCRLEPGGSFGIRINSTGASPGSGVQIYGNELLSMSNGIEFNLQSGTHDGLLIHDNHFHDPLMLGGDHIDGVHLYSFTTVFSDGKFTGLKIYNNRFDGSWAADDTITAVTGCLYFETQTGGVLIEDGEVYNNLVALDVEGSLYSQQTHTIASVFSVDSHGLLVANNTIVISDPDEYAHVFDYGSNGNGLVLENNIFTGGNDLMIFFDGAASSVVDSADYNIINSSAGDPINNNGTGRTFAEWQSDGYEANGSDASPTLNSGHAPAAGDTVARDQGTPQSAFSTDLAGVTRPKGSAWDIGAYEFQPGGGSTLTTETLNVGQ